MEIGIYENLLFALSCIFAVYTDMNLVLDNTVWKKRGKRNMTPDRVLVWRRCLVIMQYVRRYFTITMSKRGAIRRCIYSSLCIISGRGAIACMLWANGWSNAIDIFYFFLYVSIASVTTSFEKRTRSFLFCLYHARLDHAVFPALCMLSGCLHKERKEISLYAWGTCKFAGTEKNDSLAP